MVAKEERKVSDDSALIQHAERELKLAGIHQKDADYDGALYDAVMELVRVFSSQGHSGFSAMRTLQLFNIVASYKNLIPLTGENNEWVEVGENLLQNNRVGSVFKTIDTGKAYYLDAIVWKTQTGSTCTTTVNGIPSSQYIKSFPFIPKTFYIDVIEREVSKDDWEYSIKDPNQLNEVWNYYEKRCV